MKGKNKHNKLKPILKKSMLAALGLGIVLPAAGSLPSVQAGEAGPMINISRPVLNDDIYWLSHSSEQLDGLPIMPSVPIGVESNMIIIDLSTHFPSENFTQLGANSDNNTVARAYVTNDNKLVVVPYRSGKINLQLQAKNALSQEEEIVTDNIELYISKKGDLNGDDKVDSADAVQLYSYLRNMLTRRGFSYVEMNQADIDRNGEPALEDVNALLNGYANHTLGAKDNGYVLTFKQKQDEPKVLNATLKGEMDYNNTITSDVRVFNVDYGFNLHLGYQWYTSTDPSGVDMQEIPEATNSHYTITYGDANKYLILKVTPMINPGDPAIEPIFMVSKTHTPEPI